MKFAIQFAYKRSARNKKIEKQKENERATCRQRHTYIYVSDVDIQILMYRQKYIYRLIFITLSSVIRFMIFQLQLRHILR